MSGRVALFGALLAVVLTAGTAYVVRDYQRHQQAYAGSPTVARAEAPAAGVVAPARIVFRHTGTDDHYGRVASVDLADPAGARAISDRACDRVDATATAVSCLVTEPGIATRHTALDLDADLAVTGSTPLPGIPSRTRLSDDGRLVATTVFVTGHSYLATGFSTQTVVREVGGRGRGNLEDFDLVVDGRPAAPEDRNVWGVTFVDDRLFYATLATGGTTYLVEGDLLDRTLTTVAEDAECPSVSPDRTRVAFKVDVDPGPGTAWVAAVWDRDTGARTRIDATRGLDDQPEWLDDESLLYGLPRAAEPGVTDVWSVGTRTDAEPRLLIQQAWSPAVIREEQP